MPQTKDERNDLYVLVMHAGVDWGRMPHFFLKLQPPRPDFVATMTDAERAHMGEHATYVRGFYDAGKVLAYGPVFEAAGSYGFAVLDMADAVEVESFAQGDPTVRSGMNTYTVAPMMLGGSQAPRGSA